MDQVKNLVSSLRRVDGPGKPSVLPARLAPDKIKAAGARLVQSSHKVEDWHFRRRLSLGGGMESNRSPLQVDGPGKPCVLPAPGRWTGE